MKKIIFFLACLTIAFTGNSQQIIGKYKSMGREYPCYSQQEWLMIYANGGADCKTPAINLKGTQIEGFKKSLINVKEEYLALKDDFENKSDKTAGTTKMSTKIEDVLATWDHSGKSYGGIGKCTAVFKVKLHNETNRFICAPAIIVMATDLKDLQTKTGFFILFFNEKEIQSLIDILDLKLSAGKTVQASETVVQSCPAGAVDLGLKTQDGKKLYWASCNLGATAPEEFGDYYAWGELETKTDNVFSRDNYKWMKKEGWNYLYTKYNNDSSKGDVDNKIDLDPEDDVAHVKMGGNWHIPTPEEHQRLVTNLGLVWEWTTLNGIYGYKVTSNISGYEGNWIFLPAAGCRGADRLVNEDMGIYLLSRLREAPEDVNVFSFREISKESDPSAWRFNGFPIRPVYTE